QCGQELRRTRTIPIESAQRLPLRRSRSGHQADQRIGSMQSDMLAILRVASIDGRDGMEELNCVQATPPLPEAVRLSPTGPPARTGTPSSNAVRLRTPKGILVP